MYIISFLHKRFVTGVPKVEVDSCHTSANWIVCIAAHSTALRNCPASIEANTSLVDDVARCEVRLMVSKGETSSKVKLS